MLTLVGTTILNGLLAWVVRADVARCQRAWTIQRPDPRARLALADPPTI